MTAKKKLLILSCTGGYGHIAAANTLQTLLSDEYEMEVVYPIKDLRICKVPNGEAFYNYLLTNNLTPLTNWIVRTFPAKLFAQRSKKIKRMIETHISEKKIDCVISLIPFVDYPASEAARKMGIPFILVTTDNDLHNWAIDLDQKKHHQFKMTVGFDLPTSKGTMLAKNIPEEEIEVIGLPLRPEFLQMKSKEELRSEYEILQNKNVVLIMMGGTGARLSYQYLKAISQYSQNLHLIVCAGRSKKMAKKLKSIHPATGNTIDIIPFTEKVHELFALSDLILTKPGPGSINEAISCKLPILLDRIKPPVFWEEANIDLVLKYGIGACIRTVSEAPEMISRFLFDEQVRESVARAYEKVPVNQFADRIKPLLEEMMGQNLSGEVVMTSRSMGTNL
ncbi:MAG: Processive diacylglycerol beta-glucosyltransferase [Chlamydiae bacterium]|nr:Processive diacylglycerol beta-glucosyltransferase [Chlamydiota bacterium]